MMVASRNQHNVMSRAFGSTHNGSLEAYQSAGEMSNYLSGLQHRNMRGLGGGPKPLMVPSVTGEILDTTEISTRFGWGAVFVVETSPGKYVVEHYCPKSNRIVRDGKYSTVDEATKAADKVRYQLRSYGKVSGVAGIGGFGASSVTDLFTASSLPVWAVLAMYVGADFPGARPILKQTSRLLKEPKEAVQNGLMLGGFAAFSYYLLTTSDGGTAQ